MQSKKIITKAIKTMHSCRFFYISPSCTENNLSFYYRLENGVTIKKIIISSCFFLIQIGNITGGIFRIKIFEKIQIWKKSKVYKFQKFKLKKRCERYLQQNFYECVKIFYLEYIWYNFSDIFFQNLKENGH